MTIQPGATQRPGHAASAVDDLDAVRLRLSPPADEMRTEDRIRVPIATWRALSACSVEDADLFVGELTESQESAAKQICARCQVQDECLAFALAHEVRYGVWGGCDDRERAEIVRNWRRQRRQFATTPLVMV